MFTQLENHRPQLHAADVICEWTVLRRYTEFGEKFRRMTRGRAEWPIGFSEEMQSMHEALEESEERVKEMTRRLAEAEVEAAEWAEQLAGALKRAAADKGFWERVSLTIFGRKG